MLLGILPCSFSVGSLKSVIIVETAVGPLLTISGRCPGKVAVGLVIEFPEAKNGDEALKIRAPSLLWNAPGSPWTRFRDELPRGTFV